MSASSTISRRYAKAIVESARTDEQVDQFAKELLTFCQACEHSEDLINVMTNPMFNQRDRDTTLDAVFTKLQTSNLIQRFIRLLVKRSRINEINGIAAAVREIADARAKRIRAKVESAAPLSDDTRESLRRALAKRTGLAVQLDITIDPKLIGGIRTSLGSLVFDGTLSSQINGLRESLETRTD